MSKVNLLIMIALLISNFCCLDYQRQLEYESTLNYIIDLVKQGKIGDFDEDQLARCTSSKCCICEKQFKNTTCSSIHFALRHHQVLNNTQEINILFDQSLPANERYEFCKTYLQDMNLSKEHLQDVCIIISEGFYKASVVIVVIKYIMYVIVGLIGLVYYSDIARSTK